MTLVYVDCIVHSPNKYRKTEGIKTVKIKYEAKAILLVYNDVHYKQEGADVFFHIPNNPYKQPIFEVRFAKNKFKTFKGTIFFEFYPEMAYMQECNAQQQTAFSQIIYG